jgi:LDH2 family malate/lactate/ureidoglycolate dehydrogenase
MPIGGYKGYGLSLVVGLLAGTLNGAAMGKDVIDFNHDDASVTNTGQAIAVIDPAAFGDVQDFKARVDELIRDIRNSQRMPGVDRIWLPGEQSEAKRQTYLRDGIALAPALMQQLDKVAAQLQVPTLSETIQGV